MVICFKYLILPMSSNVQLVTHACSALFKKGYVEDELHH